MQEIRLYKSPWQPLKLLLGSLFPVTLGVWGIREGSMPLLAAWLNIIFFGLGGLVGLFHLLDRRVQIIINDVGIFARPIHQDCINWDSIEYASNLNTTRQTNKQTSIFLIVDSSFKPSAKKGKLSRHIRVFGKDKETQEVTISLSMFKKTDRENLIKLISFVLQLPKSERHSLLQLWNSFNA